METIQVQVSSELAQRLRPYYNDLARILEWGLRHIESEAESPPSPAKEPQQREMIAALRSTGIVVKLDPAIATRYRVGAAQSLRTPVEVKGKPLSKIIVEERGRQ